LREILLPQSFGRDAEGSAEVRREKKKREERERRREN
jgi:hypothetical protein